MFDKLSRRNLLQASSRGFGAVALSALTQQWTHADGLPRSANLPKPHHAPKAKHVIFCYMSGGVSHIDSFDPKPALEQLHGKPMPVEIARTQFNQNGNIMASPFKFQRSGESGIPISDMFPHLRDVADELAVVRSMTTSVNEHAQGNFVMHSGFPFLGHPSAGAWCAYGLGTENEDLPGYVVLQSEGASVPHGGVGLYSNGFLPGEYQGSILKADQAEAIRNIRPLDGADAQRRRLDLAHSFDASFADSVTGNGQVRAAMQNYETAFRMQTSVPSLCDISDETQRTRDLYGIDGDDKLVAGYGRQCLLARRLIQRGVRFIELSCLNAGIGAGNGPNPWDQHGDLEKGHRAMGRQVDQPIAGLITDLKAHGLLEDTLIIWTGEFGRTPFSQGSNGRDHNPYGFSVWMAGGGVKGGTIYGATDELGYYAVENKTTVYDLWATALHQLGVDHEKLAYRYSGRDFRLTDVHGNVLTDILA